MADQSFDYIGTFRLLIDEAVEPTPEPEPEPEPTDAEPVDDAGDGHDAELEPVYDEPAPAPRVSDEECQLYVDRAKALILTRRRPYSDDPLSEPWEPRFDMLACEMAAAMWWKHGADGQTASRENGIYRAWDHLDAYVPSGLLQRVVPIAAVP